MYIRKKSLHKRKEKVILFILDDSYYTKKVKSHFEEVELLSDIVVEVGTEGQNDEDRLYNHTKGSVNNWTGGSVLYSSGEARGMRVTEYIGERQCTYSTQKPGRRPILYTSYVDPH